MFPAGKKDASDAVEYDGGRTSDAIVAWALDKVAENVPAPDVLEVMTRSCDLVQWMVGVIRDHLITRIFMRRMPFLTPSQQRQRTEGQHPELSVPQSFTWTIFF